MTLSRGSRVLVGTILGMLLGSGCGYHYAYRTTPLKAYDGPTLPDSQVAILEWGVANASVSWGCFFDVTHVVTHSDVKVVRTLEGSATRAAMAPGVREIHAEISCGRFMKRRAALSMDVHAGRVYRLGLWQTRGDTWITHDREAWRRTGIVSVVWAEDVETGDVVGGDWPVWPFEKRPVTSAGVVTQRESISADASELEGPARSFGAPAPAGIPQCRIGVRLRNTSSEPREVTLEYDVPGSKGGGASIRLAGGRETGVVVA